jgi:hypothetical protein
MTVSPIFWVKLYQLKTSQGWHTFLPPVGHYLPMCVHALIFLSAVSLILSPVLLLNYNGST